MADGGLRLLGTTHSESPIPTATTARLTLALASIDIVLGIAVLLGWLANLPELTSIYPGLVQMKLHAAVALLALAVGGTVRARPRTDGPGSEFVINLPPFNSDP